MATVARAEFTRFLKDLARAIEALGDVPGRVGPANATTEAGLPYATFFDGILHHEGQRRPAPLEVSLDALGRLVVDRLREHVADLRDQIGDPVILRVAWRAEPLIEEVEGRSQIRMRLAFELCDPPPVSASVTNLGKVRDLPTIADLVDLTAHREAPVPEVVDTLERLLGLARAGELRAFGFFTVKRGGYVGTGWEAEYGHLHHLVSGASMLALRVTRDAANAGEAEAEGPAAS